MEIEEKRYVGFCPHCGEKIRGQELRTFTMTTYDIEPSPPEPPVGVGDWVIHTQPGDSKLGSPRKVWRVDPDRVWFDRESFYWRDYAKVIRRASAPPKQGDRGLLDGKIECWIAEEALIVDGLIDIVFRPEDVEAFLQGDIEGASISPSRFILTGPVWGKEE